VSNLTAKFWPLWYRQLSLCVVILTSYTHCASLKKLLVNYSAGGAIVRIEGQAAAPHTSTAAAPSSLALVPGGAKSAGAGAGASPSDIVKSLSVNGNHSSLFDSITVSPEKIHATMANTGEVDDFNLIISGTGAITASNGTVVATGALFLADSSGKMLWSFKADIFCVAAQLLVESGGDKLSFLANLARSFRPIQLRKNEFGANIGATSKGSKGGEFEVNIVQYSVAIPSSSLNPSNVAGRALDAGESVSEMFGLLHALVQSKSFASLYLNCLRENDKLKKLAKSIEKDSHPTWKAFKHCSLVKDYPVALNKFMLDADIKAALIPILGKPDASTWTAEERALAHHDGTVPGAY